MPLGHQRVKVGRRVKDSENASYLLAETWLAVLALSTVNERGRLVVEAVQTVGVLVDKGVVLGDELPADFRRVDGRVVSHRERLRGTGSVS